MINSSKRRALLAAAMAAQIFGGWVALGSAHAQVPWPNGQPIKIMVGFPAGGASDVMARLVGTKLGQALGVPVVVDNRPGAAGTLAASLTAKAPADGYTLLLASPTAITLAPSTLAGKLAYNPEKDLVPVSMVARYPLFLIAHPQLGVKNAAELVQKAKANPGKINFGSFGTVTSGGLAVEQIKLMAGIDVLHVPFNGSAPALQALMGGTVDVMFDTAITALPNIRAGKLIGLGVASPTRSPLAPELPTVAEAVPGFEADSWNGLMVPAGTPAPVLARLQAEIAKLVRETEVRERFASVGAVPIGNSTAEFAKFLKEETVSYTRLVREAKIKVD
ncbi:MAG TPA: tripartite tricarboxylate transporter substrate binding protein [Polaromonas sp.]|uniref:Bug family tripartite tricarboxylate transporter substrate binding protein n=1 Tax=Polaromonas sp. TaxID=1869339 RepID=UPI002D5F94D4|nr:tripartite tricarboxylate transporter substrate binding protein [Polaromonas sp.]HYW58132.1 tripartite tricarboxylate transporter substrate binding protein [Polaromonas sp.]